VYAPVPYNLEFEVATISKTMDEALQMMEQILPMFTPSVSLDIKVFDSTESVPFTISSVSTDFPSEVSEDEQRLYTISYYFNVRANYYNMKRIAERIYDINLTLQDPTDTLFEHFVANATRPIPVNCGDIPKDQIQYTSSWTSELGNE
jgi:hypothetical protein